MNKAGVQTSGVDYKDPTVRGVWGMKGMWEVKVEDTAQNTVRLPEGRTEAAVRL